MDIYADVIAVKGPAAARIGGAVKTVDLTWQAWQEQAVAERNCRERHIKQRFEDNHEMTARHDAAADDYGAPLAEPSIRDQAAENRREIGHRGVGAVNERGFFLADQQLLGHVVDQQGAHAVVGENLPHFGQEKYRKAARLTEPSLLLRAHRLKRVSRPTPAQRSKLGHWCMSGSAYDPWREKLDRPDRPRHKADRARKRVPLPDSFPPYCPP